MSVLRYYDCMTYVFGSSDPWFVIFNLLSYLSLVLCCDIYRSTLISIMYPACMITVHDRKSRALHVVSLRSIGYQVFAVGESSMAEGKGGQRDCQGLNTVRG